MQQARAGMSGGNTDTSGADPKPVLRTIWIRMRRELPARQQGKVWDAARSANLPVNSLFKRPTLPQFAFFECLLRYGELTLQPRIDRQQARSKYRQ